MDRKFGKRGGRGRGSFGGGRDHGEPTKKKGYLPEEMMSHYRRIRESLSQFENEEDVDQLDLSKGAFLNNVVRSLAGELTQVSQNQTVSTIVESVIVAASPANLRTLFVSAVADLSVTFLDCFASHVLESLVVRLPEFFEPPPVHGSTEDEQDDVPQEEVEESFQALCEFVDSHFETVVTHAYGSHVFRALLETLSGVSVAQELKKSQKSGHGARARKDLPQQTQKRQPSEKFKALFDKYSQRLFHVCDYEVHLKDPLFSLVLQAVLMILHEANPDLCHSHCQTILQRVADSCSSSEDDTDGIPDMAQDMAGSHLLEVMFKLSREELMLQTFDTLMQGKLLHYAIHPTGNHVLQTFIASLHDARLMERVYEELSKHLEDVLAVGYFGLVTTLAAGCRRLRVKQDDLINCLMEAFHCKDPQERQKSLMKLIASFTTYEVFFTLEEGKDKPAEGAEEPALKCPVILHGSRLIQELLQFQKPIHAARGLLDWKASELQQLCCDPAGSHIVDVYFSSSTVIEKNRDIFLRKLKGLLVEVACSKNGSRCLESVWKSLNITQRTAIARELSDNERVHADRFGHFLHRNFQLALFASHRKRWQEQQGTLVKRKRRMKELLQNTGSESPAKKQRMEKPQHSIQKEDPIEDSVTAMFIKQKKQLDAKHLLPTPPQTHSDSEDEDVHLSPSSSSSPVSVRPEENAPKERKKKRKEKRKPEATSPPVTMKKKDKVRDVTAALAAKLKKDETNAAAATPKLTKKKKKSVTASPTMLSEGDESEKDSAKKAKKMKKRLQKDSVDSIEKAKKKKKSFKKSRDGEDE